MRKNHARARARSREVEPRGKFDRIGAEIQETFRGRAGGRANAILRPLYFQRNYDLLPSSFWETSGGGAGASLTHAGARLADRYTIVATVATFAF